MFHSQSINLSVATACSMGRNICKSAAPFPVNVPPPPPPDAIAIAKLIVSLAQQRRPEIISKSPTAILEL